MYNKRKAIYIRGSSNTPPGPSILTCSDATCLTPMERGSSALRFGRMCKCMRTAREVRAALKIYNESASIILFLGNMSSRATPSGNHFEISHRFQLSISTVALMRALLKWLDPNRLSQSKYRSAMSARCIRQLRPIIAALAGTYVSIGPPSYSRLSL